MRIHAIAMAMLLVGGSLALAQVCPPGSACLVPARVTTSTTTTTPSTGTSSVTVPYTYTTPVPYVYGTSVTGTCAAPMAVMPMTGVSGACPGNVSPDTACLLNQLAALQNEVRATRSQIYASGLELRGQMLTSRLNQLIADEMTFRQQLAANPNMPNARIQAMQLQDQADSLNRDIAAYNTELSMVPTDQRPFIATEMNTFTRLYWDPTLQRFADYRTQFQQNASVAYQPAVAANPWLTNWQTTYTASINNIAASPQTYASVRWWTSPTSTAVLGTTEVFPATSTTVMPGGSIMMLPNGAAIYIPPNAVPMSSVPGTTVCPMGTMPAGTTVVPATPAPSTY